MVFSALFSRVRLFSYLLFIASFLAFFFFTATPSFAQTLQNSTNVSSSERTRVQSTLIELVSALFCQTAGVDLLSPQQPCLQADPVNGVLSYAQKPDENYGAIGAVSSLIGMTYTIPVHSSDYVSYMASNFGIAKPTYAQTGYDSLNSLLPIWKKFRDISYMGFVLGFVLLGGAIMLRVKIDPRTVMTIQNQIPKAIIALLLITFSYAIAGLMIDIMWVGTYTGINIISENETNCGASDTLTDVATRTLLQNPVNYVHDLFSNTGCVGTWGGISGLSKKIGFSMSQIVKDSALSIFELDTSCGFFEWDCLRQNAIFGTLQFIIGILATLIIFMAILFTLFRIWWILIKSYAYVLIYVAIAPLWIVLGIVPTSSQGFGTWFRHLLARLAVFPATAIMLVAARVLAVYNAPTGAQTDAFTPPLIGNPNTVGNIGWLAAFGVLMITPEIINMLQSVLKAPSTKYTASLTQGIGAGRAAVGGFGGALAGTLFAKNSQGVPTGPLSYMLQDKLTAPLSRLAFGQSAAMKYNPNIGVNGIFGRGWFKRDHPGKNDAKPSAEELRQHQNPAPVVTPAGGAQTPTPPPNPTGGTGNNP